MPGLRRFAVINLQFQPITQTEVLEALSRIRVPPLERRPWPGTEGGRNQSDPGA